MGFYKCIVLNNTGKRRILKIEGLSKDDVLKQLTKNNFIVINMAKSISMDKINPFNENKTVNAKELSLLCKQMHTMLKSGITVVKCLDILCVQSKNRQLKKLLSKIYFELLTGCTFSEALKKFSKCFPAMFVTLIEAGEKSGNLVAVTKRLSAYYTQENSTENKIKSALAYPVILSVVSLSVIIFLITHVLPAFVDLYNYSDASLPFMTLLFLDMSYRMGKSWKIIILFFAVVTFVLVKLYKNENFGTVFDKYKLHVPFFGGIELKNLSSKFSRSLSILIGNGVSLLDGLDVVSAAVNNKYISKVILNIREDVKSGSSLSYSLKNQNIFPEMFFSMAYIGEESGELAETLDKIADFYDEDIENYIHRLVTLIEPAIIIIMAVIVGFIVLSIAVPMFDIINFV